MNELQLTRENVIDIKGQLDALTRKAQCRSIACDVVDMLAKASEKLEAIDELLTEMIGD